LRHDLPIDLDAAGGDQFLAGAAAAESRRSQDFLQPFEAVVGSRLAGRRTVSVGRAGPRRGRT
jgi:hypothetical protein